MAFVPTPNGAGVVFDMETQANTWSFGLNFSLSGLDGTEAAALKNGLKSDLIVPLMTYLTTDSYYNGMTIYDLSSDSAPKYSYPAATPIQGSAAGNAASVATTICVTLRSNNRGRSSHGRVYISGIEEGSVDADSISSTLCNNVASLFNDLTAGITGTAAVLSVLSTVTGGADRTSGLLQTVTSALARNYVIASQRRRLRKS